MLLQLPAELQLYILHLLDPDTFALAILVCKNIRQLALDNKALLERKLRSVPGCWDESGEYTPERLMRIFNRRAARHLKNGAGVMSNTLQLSNWNPIGLPACSLHQCPCQQDHLIVTAVGLADQTLRIYAIRSQRPVLKCIVSPNSFGQKGCSFRILKYSFHGASKRSSSFTCLSKLSVVYSYTVNAPHDHPFVQSALKRSMEHLKLVTFSLDSSFGTACERICDIEILPDEELTAFAVGQDDNSIFCFKRPHSHVVSFYLGPNSDMSIIVKRNEFGWEDDTMDKHTPITGIEVVGRRAELFVAGSPIPRYYVSDFAGHSPSITGVDNSVPYNSWPDGLLFSPDPFARGSIGVPLDTKHAHDCRDLNVTDTFCVNTILQLVINRSVQVPDSTVSVRRQGCLAGAFLVKATQYPSHCKHADTEHRYPALEHFIVAKLVGFDLHTNSSRGHILAMSPSRKRIAIAVWNKVLVWTVSLAAFLDPGKQNKKAQRKRSKKGKGRDWTLNPPHAPPPPPFAVIPPPPPPPGYLQNLVVPPPPPQQVPAPAIFPPAQLPPSLVAAIHPNDTSSRNDDDANPLDGSVGVHGLPDVRGLFEVVSEDQTPVAQPDPATSDMQTDEAPVTQEEVVTEVEGQNMDVSETVVPQTATAALDAPDPISSPSSTTPTHVQGTLPDLPDLPNIEPPLPPPSPSNSEASVSPSSQHSDSDDEPVDPDNAYVHRCGHDYYDGYAPHNGQIVHIPPIELPRMGVVYSMCWNGEDGLWAWTDRGLCRWGFNESVRGQMYTITTEKQEDETQEVKGYVGKGKGKAGESTPPEAQTRDDGVDAEISVNRKGRTGKEKGGWCDKKREEGELCWDMGECGGFV